MSELVTSRSDAGSPSKHPFFWMILIYAVIFSLFVSLTITSISRYGQLKRDLGWEYGFTGDDCYITRVDRAGPAYGKLQKGDRIVAINGNRAFRGFAIQEQKFVMVPSPSYSITIERNSAQLIENLTAIEQKDPRRLIPILAILLATLIHGVISSFVGLSRPGVKTIRLFAMAGMSLAVSQQAAILLPITNFFGPSALKLSYLCMLFALNPMAVPLAFDFYARFPADFPESRLWKFSKKAFYIWAALLTLGFTVFRLLMVLNVERGTAFAFAHTEGVLLLRRSSDFLSLLALIAICCVVTQNYRRLSNTDDRRRILWVVYGGIAGILPIGFYFLGSMLIHWHVPFAPKASTLTAALPFTMLSLVLVPLSVAYAILKNRIFDIQIVIRRGVQYLLAKRVLQILIYLPVILIVYTIYQNPNRTISSLLFSPYVALLIASALGLLFRKSLLNALDQKFFRSAYNSEKILVGLVDEIKKFGSMTEVARWVSRQLESALHPNRILVFYRQKNRRNLVLGYSSGEHDSNEIPEHFQFVQMAEKQAKSINISSEEFALPGSEKQWVHQNDVHLVVPMIGSDEFLYGVLLLGEKKSEEPYSATDRTLLEALAGQMAVVYENLILKDQVDEGQRVQRDVLAHLTEQRRNLLKECPVCGTCFDSSEEKCKEDQAELVLALPVYRVIDGKYRLDKLIGKGGMGAVYQASDLRLNRDVAIKILLGNKFGDSQALKRFTREARASARLNHPNVISIYDFGGIGDGAYLVMELLHGYTLRTALEQWGRIRPEIAATWFEQILEGVKAAHLHGIIHRDLKPENILITHDAKNQALIKILDFGLAKITLFDGIQSKTLTVPGTVMGTLYYMSPEQICGDEVDERTDIFSLGVIAVETLTGRRPFEGRNAQEVAMAIIQKDVKLQNNSDEAIRLNLVIQKCVAKNRDARFSTIAEMQNEFIEAMRSANIARTPESAPHPGADSATKDFLSS